MWYFICICIGVALEALASSLWRKNKISSIIDKEKAVLEAKLEALKKAL